MQAKAIEEYYSRKDVAEVICAAARGREAVGAYHGRGYDSRPNIIQYPSDVTQLARKGISSFHISVEKWQNAMQLSAERDYSQLRTGWDLLIDIDSNAGMEAAKIAALVVCDFLDKNGVRGYGIKFSGSRGFHICIPWNAFPEEVDFKPLAKDYPETARIIIGYMKDRIKDTLMRALLEKMPGRLLGDAITARDPYKAVEIEKDWGPRHLFRAPYSLNEKTWYVSVPLIMQELKSFHVSMANTLTVNADRKFFPENADAEKLLVKALDWHAFIKKQEEMKKPALKEERRGKAPEQYFPPCINAILQGLSEGRKRSVFTLATFLHSVGWDWDEIEKHLDDWNERNRPPLPRNYIKSQLNWHKHQKRQINAPNCYNDHFLKSIGMCQGELQCKIAKNPMNYPFRRMAKARKLEPQKKKGQNAVYSCDLCERKFESMQGLQIHRTRWHGAE
ncbi:MAG: hypothetical protein HYW25_02955 [Candidatus Aenigmarchaeota archaeon]|nr:hypothetical protein [Candidatus Aenigmarchaeota archaeon]